MRLMPRLRVELPDELFQMHALPLELLRIPTTLPSLHLPLLSYNRKVRGRTVGPT